MKIKYPFLILLSLVFCAGGCNLFDNAPDVSDVEVESNLVPFYEELFAIPPENADDYTEALQKKYGDYFTAYCEGIIGIGKPGDKEFSENLGRFLSYKPNKEVFDTCRKVFSEHRKEKIHKALIQAFKYYKHYYPERNVPDVYLHISGFNESMVVDSGWVSVSVEKYLGRNCIFYEWLGTPQYLRTQMFPEMVVPDVMRAIAMTEYAYNDSIDDLISQMIYHGKVLHFVKHTIPDIPDTLLFGYPEKEMKWCEKNEEFMWASMVEHKHLFSTDQMLIRKYVGPAPFTSFFGQESPGRTGRYIGYQIMKSWLEKNPDKSFRDMMEASDPHRILSQAKYRP